ncbi:transcriptional regulator, GntR family [Eubacterium nodatum ATCC 33099]|nr:transcriptional regulator, GntR family [Eubacterium nodatum ATCC 33099]
MLNFELQNHRPLREIVYEQLKIQILTGKIAPGTRMMEVELAEDLGVSRTPVREAIRKLEKEALVVIEPRRGAYVSDVSVKEMVDTLVVREDLEALAASLTAKRITKEELEGLEKKLPTIRKPLPPEIWNRLYGQMKVFTIRLLPYRETKL